MSTEPVTPETEQSQPDAPASLAEHRKDFPSKARRAEQPAESEVPTEKPVRHRAKSQRAQPEDADTIARLTKELREAEQDAKIERKDGESDRVYELRKRVELTKAATARAALEAKQPQTPQAPAPRVEPQRFTPTATEFTEKEPTIDQFAKDPDPYSSWQRAVAKYDRRKEAFDEHQQANKATIEQQRKQFDSEMLAGMSAHAQRVVAYANANPESKALIDAERAKPEHEQIQLTMAMRGAIEFHERGPEFVVELLKHPDLADELFLLTDGKPIGDPRTDPFVASVRRRLLQRVQAASSGSVASLRQTHVAPRPPNPERTAPQTPRQKPSDAPAGSLAEHRKRFPARH